MVKKKKSGGMPSMKAGKKSGKGRDNAPAKTKGGKSGKAGKTRK